MRRGARHGHGAGRPDEAGALAAVRAGARGRAGATPLVVLARRRRASATARRRRGRWGCCGCGELLRARRAAGNAQLRALNPLVGERRAAQGSARARALRCRRRPGRGAGVACARRRELVWVQRHDRARGARGASRGAWRSAGRVGRTPRSRQLPAARLPLRAPRAATLCAAAALASDGGRRHGRRLPLTRRGRAARARRRPRRAGPRHLPRRGLPRDGARAAADATATAAALRGVFFLQPLAVEAAGLLVECVVADGRFEVRSGGAPPAASLEDARRCTARVRSPRRARGSASTARARARRLARRTSARCTTASTRRAAVRPGLPHARARAWGGATARVARGCARARRTRARRCTRPTSTTRCARVRARRRAAAAAARRGCRLRWTTRCCRRAPGELWAVRGAARADDARGAALRCGGNAAEAVACGLAAPLASAARRARCAAAIRARARSGTCTRPSGVRARRRCGGACVVQRSWRCGAERASAGARVATSARGGGELGGDCGLWLERSALAQRRRRQCSQARGGARRRRRAAAALRPPCGCALRRRTRAAPPRTRAHGASRARHASEASAAGAVLRSPARRRSRGACARRALEPEA